MKDIIKEVYPYIIIIIAVLLIKTYLVAPVRVNGTSMYQTLHDKDVMILNKVVYKFSKIKRFDIVVVETENEPLIKRVIGLPGERVEYKDNKLYINGELVNEKFYHAQTDDFSTKELGSILIPKDSCLVLGDNRTNSLDSRYYGFIKKKNIVGRARLTILPVNRIGIKK